MTAGSESDEPLDLALPVLCADVDVEAAPPVGARLRLAAMEREVRPPVRGIAQDDRAVRCRLADHVVQGLLPEGQHPFEVATADGGGLEVQLTGHRGYRRFLAALA